MKGKIMASCVLGIVSSAIFLRVLIKPPIYLFWFLSKRKRV